MKRLVALVTTTTKRTLLNRLCSTINEASIFWIKLSWSRLLTKTFRRILTMNYYELIRKNSKKGHIFLDPFDGQVWIVPKWSIKQIPGFWPVIGSSGCSSWAIKHGYPVIQIFGFCKGGSLKAFLEEKTIGNMPKID